MYCLLEVVVIEMLHAENSKPGYPHHVIQRGHNRQVVFASDEDMPSGWLIRFQTASWS